MLFALICSIYTDTALSIIINNADMDLCVQTLNKNNYHALYYSLGAGLRALDEVGVAFCDGKIGATPTEVGERRGLTTIERG